MVSLIRYGTLSALCLLICSLSAKAGMFPLMAVAHAAAHPSGSSGGDVFPAEPSHFAAPDSISQSSIVLTADLLNWSAIPNRLHPTEAVASPAPVWLYATSHKRATPFDLRS